MIFLRTPGRNDTLTLNMDATLRDHAGVNGGIQHVGFRLLDKADLDRAVQEVEAAGGLVVLAGAAGLVTAVGRVRAVSPANRCSSHPQHSQRPSQSKGSDRT
jgi:hypothetical protein